MVPLHYALARAFVTARDPAFAETSLVGVAQLGDRLHGVLSDEPAGVSVLTNAARTQLPPRMAKTPDRAGARRGPVPRLSGTRVPSVNALVGLEYRWLAALGKGVKVVGGSNVTAGSWSTTEAAIGNANIRPSQAVSPSPDTSPIRCHPVR